MNRAVLARQLLLERSSLSVEDAIKHLVGMQAQLPSPPYFGLWTRLEQFEPEALSNLIESRRMVRVALMRGTIHLATASDALTIRPLVQSILTRTLLTNHKGLVGLELDPVVAAGRALVDEQPILHTELGKRLQKRWPDRPASDLATAVRAYVPLVQVPPRGLWGRSGHPTVTSIEAWLGRPLAKRPSIGELVLRYLRSFGPASVNDVQTWSGLRSLREVVERLRPQLVTFEDEHGVELFDLPDAPRPNPSTPAPVRFLPPYDNLLLSHADRTRVMADEHRKLLFFSKNAVFPGSVLVDGFMSAFWKLEASRAKATLVIEPFAPVSKPQRAELEVEGLRLLEFAAPRSGGHDVRIAAPK